MSPPPYKFRRLDASGTLPRLGQGAQAPIGTSSRAGSGAASTRYYKESGLSAAPTTFDPTGIFAEVDGHVFRQTILFFGVEFP